MMSTRKRIFISSTFKDMQSERDLLHYRVFPKLRERLGGMGETIQELDLRWGVDTSTMSEEESGRRRLDCPEWMLSPMGWILPVTRGV